MEQTRKKLPPLKGLAVLECVVRHESVTRASEELCVTHSAISKQLALLEQWADQPLFEKNRKRMVPTSSAVILAKAAGVAWQAIGEAVDEIGARQRDEVLRVVAPATFAMRWLIPRLWSFSTQNSRVSVQVVPTHTGERWADLPYDVAIRHANQVPPEVQPTPLLRETLGLLAAPRALAKGFRSGTFRTSHIPLLTSETRKGELEAWLKAASQPPALALRARQFAHFYIALEAALAGEGALVSPVLITADLIRRGDLVDPLPQIRVASAEYVAFCAPHTEHRHHGMEFVSWLTASAREVTETALSEISA